MDGLWDIRGDSALDEVQERLTVIYNQIRGFRADMAGAQQVLATCEGEIDRLLKVESEYLALLVPQGSPAYQGEASV